MHKDKNKWQIYYNVKASSSALKSSILISTNTKHLTHSWLEYTILSQVEHLAGGLKKQKQIYYTSGEVWTKK